MANSERIINWKYNIGQSFKDKKHDITIINREEKTKIDKKSHKIRSRCYYILCNKCGYKFYKTERSVEGYCPCCTNKVVVNGINDVATTHPEIVKYFENIEDAYTHTYGSEKYVWCVCPICGTRKHMQVQQLTHQGLSCQNCSDGISYPEKFVANIFAQLNIPFIRQFSKRNAIWVGDKFYDLYLPNYNMIIEVHGMQHYKQSFTVSSYEKQIKIDKEKRDNAIQNNIAYYIEIDARYSNMDFIKTSIMNNELSNIIDMSNIKWELCNEAGCNSIMKMVCDFWEENKDDLTTSDVAKYFQLDRCTVASYLKKGTINGWCKYDAKESLLKTQKNNSPKIDYDIVKEVCNDWSNGLGVLDLSKKYSFSEVTITSYLKYGNKNNLCDYSASEAKKRGSTKLLTSSRQVNVYKNGEYIISEINARILSEVSLEKLGVKLCRSNIAAVCNRDRNQHHGFVFRYDDDDEFKL